VAAALPGYLLAIAWLDHGLSASLGKLGAFAGRCLCLPLLQASLGLRGTLLLTAGLAFLGLLLTRTLPERPRVPRPAADPYPARAGPAQPGRGVRR
jgi:hypothetical protein